MYYFICDFWRVLSFRIVIICLKVFKILCMKVLSSESEYLRIFLILLKLTGIASISNLWNQRCRYLSQILIRKQKRWACKNVTLYSCFLLCCNDLLCNSLKWKCESFILLSKWVFFIRYNNDNTLISYKGFYANLSL